MGLREQSNVGCIPEFFRFSVVKVLLWLRKQFINNFVLPTWASTAGFNNNIKNTLWKISSGGSISFFKNFIVVF